MDWLLYLCLNSSCRGVGGHELVDSGLTSLPGLASGNRYMSAEEIRAVMRLGYQPHGENSFGGDAQLAKLNLLGLTPETNCQPRALRRQSAARAMLQPINTFQRHGELLLLLDVATDLWTCFGSD